MGLTVGGRKLDEVPIILYATLVCYFPVLKYSISLISLWLKTLVDQHSAQAH